MQQKQLLPLAWINSIPRPRMHAAALGAALRSGWLRLWPGFLLWALFAVFLALVQFSSPDLPDNDGYYHIKLAAIMRTEGLKPAFPWLPLSILNPREFYDHHFLFHAALAPFTGGDLRLGAKWAAVLFASLAFLSVWYVLKNQRVPLAGLWALGLTAVSEAFIYRMSITRAQSLSLAVLMLGVDALLRRKYRRLAALGFLYVWLYDAFPLLLICAGVYAAAAWLVDRRLELRPVVYTGVGIALGLVINPYLPHNIVFAAQHILPKLFETTAVSVGNEWYPYETAQLLENSPLALAAFLSGALALGFSGRKIDLRTAFAFLLACLFGLMLFQSRRFIEYFPAFALVFAAFAWAPVITRFCWKRRAAAPAVAARAGAAAGPAAGGVANLPVRPGQPAGFQTLQHLRRGGELAGGQHARRGARIPDGLGRFPAPVLLQHAQYLPDWARPHLYANLRPQTVRPVGGHHARPGETARRAHRAGVRRALHRQRPAAHGLSATGRAR